MKGLWIPTLQHPAVAPLVNAAFNTEVQFQETTVACYSPEIDTRMLVQQGTFTIHGGKTALDETPEGKKSLTQFVISPDAKPRLRQILQILNINRSTLFPDLDNLSRELKMRIG